MNTTQEQFSLNRAASSERLLCSLSLVFAVAVSAVAELTVDFSQTNGVIRPLHGVNLGPLCYRGMVDLSAYHCELGVPLTRLHDVVWVNYDAVDISTIFRDFRNDPALPDSYPFAATDDYIAAVVKTGSSVLYRLGESIEHTPRKYRVHPPKDFGKWADICCAIIRHYNEDWAGGFRYNIRYWEIWNEPENQPAMWTGTDDQYFQLYEITAKAIKARWPDLKVGGPSLGYTGEFKDGQFKAGDFLLRFLHHCRDHQDACKARALCRRVGAVEHRHANRREHAAPRALEDPEQHQLEHGLGETAQHRRDREQRDRRQEGALGAETVSDPPRGRNPDREADQVPDHDAIGRRRADGEAPSHRREGDVDDGHVHDRHEHGGYVDHRDDLLVGESQPAHANILAQAGRAVRRDALLFGPTRRG